MSPLGAVVVAALFVDGAGCYVDMFPPTGIVIDPWPIHRDARKYDGPHPVVAHPPCTSWGAFARSGMTKRPLGDDDGCFAAALAAVRRWGGVLEHPAFSSAWSAFDLPRPGAEGWSARDELGGAACSVDQGFYGFKACRKPTWLYACGVRLPDLLWGRAPALRPPPGPRGRRSSWDHFTRHGMRSATPLAFRDLLLRMAATAAERGP